MPESDPEQAVAELTKILGDPTRRRIYFFARASHEPVRVADISEAFFLHRNVARAHLDKLAKAGFLKTDRRQGKSGRPARTFAPTDKRIDFAIPGRDYQALADLTIEVLASGESMDGMIARATALGREWQKGATVEAGTDRPMTAAAELVAKRLTALGAEATSYDLGDSIELEVRNCLFRECADRHPEVVCQAHQSMIGGMFEAAGVPVDLDVAETLPEGGVSCRFGVSSVVP
jgi:predicted ArsR family transcriptional regulator